MVWSAPIVQEVCVGMEVTSYESDLTGILDRASCEATAW
ncbi:pyrroloquinoline quinone precursor peptide PqqA [Methylobacterium durans]|uniref:Coenzyme PQQ synthesis protein A n=1 Tax=Methylobacterium durans TaxID=2202825 RepID=A0A2U8W1V6_9HYPH|nr:pyrroloquinoline quinone precursor peptide PqqA [Methylobacterium durans]